MPKKREWYVISESYLNQGAYIIDGGPFDNRAAAERLRWKLEAKNCDLTTECPGDNINEGAIRLYRVVTGGEYRTKFSSKVVS